jgi:hypothetical protein
MSAIARKVERHRVNEQPGRSGWDRLPRDPRENRRAGDPVRSHWATEIHARSRRFSFRVFRVLRGFNGRFEGSATVLLRSALGAVLLLAMEVCAVGQADRYVVSSSNCSPVAGSVVTITAQLADAGEFPVATEGKTMTWSETGAGGSFGSLTSTTSAEGVATVSFTTSAQTMAAGVSSAEETIASGVPTSHQGRRNGKGAP